MKPIVFTDKDLVRFWDKVAIRGSDDCWEWGAGCFADGYGAFRVSGKMLRAPRCSYTQVFGTIPVGLLVCHKCDNPKCVNPNHLFLGTNADNTRDMALKGRRAVFSGESHGHAKLTENDVLVIRAEYSGGGVAQRDLARRYNVRQQAISRVVTKKTWGHI